MRALIRKDVSTAVYAHCSGHRLNLVIADSCGLPVVRNILDKMKASVVFFTKSPKRVRLLAEVVTKGGHPLAFRKPPTDVCRTSWAAVMMPTAILWLVHLHCEGTCPQLALGLHHDEYSADVTTGWERKYRAEASSLLSGLAKFDFIVTFLVVYQELLHLAGITIKVQSTSLNVVQAHRMMEDVKDLYENLRETIDADLSTIYD